MEQGFGISEEMRDGTSIVTVEGEVDVATAHVLRDCFDLVIGRDDGPVVVDLAGVTFIDSTGLGVLIGARKRCDVEDRDLRVVIDEPRILKVFEITGLTDLFSIHPSLELALAA